MNIHVMSFCKNKEIFIKHKTSLRNENMNVETELYTFIYVYIFEIAFKMDIFYLSIFGVYFLSFFFIIRI